MAVKVDITFEMVDKISKNLGRVQKSVQKLGKSRLTSITDGFAKLAIGITGINQGFQLMSNVVRKTTGFLNKFVDAAIKVEDLTTQFKVLTGSLSDANKLIKDLQ